MDYKRELEQFRPATMQEEKDKQVMEEYLKCFSDTVLTRENEFAHFTASSMIMNKDNSKVLMVFHNIYHSWSWTGGHADGDTDFLEVALKEAAEETGASQIRPLTDKLITLDILPVWGHVKRGMYVSAHQHLNFSYLLTADEAGPLSVKEDENSQVGWLPVQQLQDYVTEPDMIPVYEKIIQIAKNFN